MVERMDSQGIKHVGLPLRMVPRWIFPKKGIKIFLWNSESIIANMHRYGYPFDNLFQKGCLFLFLHPSFDPNR